MVARGGQFDGQDLYGLPLERFVPERAALAKALRAEGRREAAAEVAKLPKPSRAAWAVNQLVRTQRREMASLFEAGDALQQVQADVVAGRGNARALREASERERAAVGRLTAAARGLLSSDGHALTAATLDRVTETLHAAALDAEARSQVERGCLERELRHVGLGDLGALRVPESDDAQRTAREQAEQLEAAQRAEADADQRAKRAVRALEEAHRRRDRAAGELQAAEDALAAAQDEADEAAEDAMRARNARERLQP